MIVYFDTSAILPIVIEEPSSAVASRLWDEADRVVSSRLVYAEGRAALAMARRMNRIDELTAKLEQSQQRVKRLIAESECLVALLAGGPADQSMPA